MEIPTLACDFALLCLRNELDSSYRYISLLMTGARRLKLSQELVVDALV